MWEPDLQIDQIQGYCFEGQKYLNQNGIALFGFQRKKNFRTGRAIFAGGYAWRSEAESR